MRNFFKEGKASLTIQISQQGVKLTRERGCWPRRSEVLADHAWRDTELENSLESVANLIATRLPQILLETECKKMPLTVVFSDACFRMWMVTPPQNVSSFSDCQAAASLRFLSLYGETTNDWEIAADWDAALPFLACALPRSLLKAVREVAEEFQLTLLDVLPQFTWQWNRWRKQIAAGAWFAVLNQQELTLAIIAQNRILTLRSIDLTAASHENKTWLCQYLKRESLRLNLPQATQLQVCGAVPDAWLVATDGGVLCSRLDSSDLIRTKVELVETQNQVSKEVNRVLPATSEMSLRRKQG
jgi:hypothetical protein